MEIKPVGVNVNDPIEGSKEITAPEGIEETGEAVESSETAQPAVEDTVDEDGDVSIGTGSDYSGVSLEGLLDMQSLSKHRIERWETRLDTLYEKLDKAENEKTGKKILKLLFSGGFSGIFKKVKNWFTERRIKRLEENIKQEEAKLIDIDKEIQKRKGVTPAEDPNKTEDVDKTESVNKTEDINKEEDINKTEEVEQQPVYTGAEMNNLIDALRNGETVDRYTFDKILLELKLDGKFELHDEVKAMETRLFPEEA